MVNTNNRILKSSYYYYFHCTSSHHIFSTVLFVAICSLLYFLSPYVLHCTSHHRNMFSIDPRHVYSLRTAFPLLYILHITCPMAPFAPHLVPYVLHLLPTFLLPKLCYTSHLSFAICSESHLSISHNYVFHPTFPLP